MNPDDLADEAFMSCPEIVVITGGEPAIHNLQGLAYQLKSRNLPSPSRDLRCLPCERRD